MHMQWSNTSSGQFHSVITVIEHSIMSNVFTGSQHYNDSNNINHLKQYTSTNTISLISTVSHGSSRLAASGNTLTMDQRGAEDSDLGGASCMHAGRGILHSNTPNRHAYGGYPTIKTQFVQMIVDVEHLDFDDEARQNINHWCAVSHHVSNHRSSERCEPGPARPRPTGPGQSANARSRVACCLSFSKGLCHGTTGWNDDIEKWRRTRTCRECHQSSEAEWQRVLPSMICDTSITMRNSSNSSADLIQRQNKMK